MKYGHMKTFHIDRRVKLAARAWRKMVDGLSGVMPVAITRRVSTTVRGTRRSMRSLAGDILMLS